MTEFSGHETKSQRDAANYYDNEYHLVIHKHLLEDDNYFYARGEAAARLYFGSFSPPLGNVLEYGCGMGQNISAIPGAVGYDISAEALAACKRRGVATIADEREIPRNHFDYILSRHSLEHVERPLDDLKQMFTYLKPGGLLILVLPKEGHGLASLHPDRNQHLYCWNFRCINNLVFRAGGIVLENHYVSVLGYRRLLPVRKILGATAYFHATRWIGALWRVTELIIHAKATE